MKKLICKRCKGLRQILDYSDEDYKSGKLGILIWRNCPDCSGRGYFQMK